jgi:hypothetical protein
MLRAIAFGTVATHEPSPAVLALRVGINYRGEDV